MIALAGRRIDEPGADAPRFPLAHVDRVGDRLRALFEEERPAAVVSSAACGADLVALDAAARLLIRRRVVLPFDAPRFRATSVTNRPGAWGALFDRMTTEARAARDLIVLEGAPFDETAAYEAANRRILEEALSLASAAADVVAVLVWEGSQRGHDDLTAAFGEAAATRGLRLRQVSTL